MNSQHDSAEFFSKWILFRLSRARVGQVDSCNQQHEERRSAPSLIAVRRTGLAVAMTELAVVRIELGAVRTELYVVI
jgi:hypothetical protein